MSLEAESPTPITDDQRARLLRMFEERLDAALDQEELPPGLAAGPAPGLAPGLAPGPAPDPVDLPDRYCDQYAIWSSLTALLQETRLQGRAFRDLDESLRGLLDQGVQPRAEMDFAAAPLIPPHEDPSVRALVEILIDTQERLKRNLQSADVALRPEPQHRRIWPWAQSHHAREEGAIATSRALRDGIDLALRVLHDHLDRLGIVEIGSPGERFDPDTMRAIEVQRSSDIPDGCVVDVLRSGYEWNGALLRPAEVRVARTSDDARTHAGNQGDRHE